MKKLSVLSLLTLLFAACAPAEDGDKTLKIGFLGPLTGDAASYGNDTMSATMLAIDEINAAGGVNGMQVQLIAEDGRCNPADAASAAQKLVNVNKVVAIIGGQCSGETLAAAPIANAGQTVMLSPVSSSPDVTDAGDFIFRDYPSDALKTKAMANYFAEQGFTKVAAISENTDFAVAFRNSLKENLPEGALVFDELVEPNTKDFRSLITRLEDLEFDVFFPNGQTSSTIGAMMVQLREQGFEQLAVSHDVAQDASIFTVAEEAAEGMQAIGVPEVSADGEFGSKFITNYGQPQAGLAFAAHAYDATYVLLNTIAQVGTEGTAIRDALYSMPAYRGVVGSFTFDSNGDVVGIPYNLYEAQEGAWVPVADIAVN